jgi:hypothetical protein
MSEMAKDIRIKNFACGGTTVGVLSSLGFCSYLFYQICEPSVFLEYLTMIGVMLFFGMPLHIISGAVGGGIGTAIGAGVETVEEYRSPANA